MRMVLASCRTHPRSTVDAEALAGPLRERGADVRVAPWDDPSLQVAGAVVHLLSPWDYQTRFEEFLAWCESAATQGVLVHGPDVIRWNIHKGYLEELAARGVPTLPMRVVTPGGAVSATELAAEWGVTELVLKPAVGAGAQGLVRLAATDDAAVHAALAELGARGDVVIQPFAPGIVEHGELSIVCINGEPCHTVVKRPARGDFRVQVHFGGTVSVRPVTDEELRMARKLLERIGRDFVYARLDLLPGLDGEWCLGELEVIEPELFLRHAPRSAAKLADALVALSPT